MFDDRARGPTKWVREEMPEAERRRASRWERRLFSEGKRGLTNFSRVPVFVSLESVPLLSPSEQLFLISGMIFADFLP